jgi:hypothetical protein
MNLVVFMVATRSNDVIDRPFLVLWPGRPPSTGSFHIPDFKSVKDLKAKCLLAIARYATVPGRVWTCAIHLRLSSPVIGLVYPIGALSMFSVA